MLAARQPATFFWLWSVRNKWKKCEGASSMRLSLSLLLSLFWFSTMTAAPIDSATKFRATARIDSNVRNGRMITKNAILFLFEVLFLGGPLFLLATGLLFSQLYYGPLSEYIDSFKIISKGSDETGLYYALDEDVTYYNRHCTAEDISTISIQNKTERSNLLMLEHDAPPQQAQDVMMTHGALILPQVLSDETATRLRDYLESRHDIKHKLGFQEKFWSEISRLALGLGSEDHPSIKDAIYEIGTNPLIQNTLEGIFGSPDAAIVETSTLTCLFGAENQYLHTDSDFFGSSLLYSRTFLHSYTMFIALQDTTSRMGATTVCPGTHWCANEDMYDFCLKATDDDEYLYDENEAFDVSSNGLTGKMTGVLKKGDAMMFNQNVFHRGPQNNDPEFKDFNRVMFIVTFVNKRDYEKTGDVRQQGMGTYYYQRWNMWGHLYSDFKDILSRSKGQGFWKQPWTTLKALGITSATQAVPWLEHWARQFANQMDFSHPGELPEFKKYLVSCCGKWVEYLQNNTSDEDWHEYVVEILENVQFYTFRLYAIGAAAYVFSALVLTKSSTKIVKRLVYWHCFIGGIGLCLFYFLNFHSYFGRQVQGNEINTRPFPKTEHVTEKTTIPDRMDYLVGSRFHADFLGSYNHALDYHPGNVHLHQLIRLLASTTPLPLECVESIIWKEWQQGNAPPRFLLQDFATGDWIESDTPKAILKEMILQDQRPLLRKLNTHLLQALANARFGRQRQTAMARIFDTQFVQDWQQILLWSDSIYASSKSSSTTNRPKLSWKSMNSLATLERMNKKLSKSPSQILYKDTYERVWAASVGSDGGEGRWEQAKVISKDNDIVRVQYAKNGVTERDLSPVLVQPYRHLVEGNMVQVLLEDESDEDNFYWQDAIIRHASPLGFYDLQVVFDNEQAGEILERVLPEDVRIKPTDTSLQIGQLVWAPFPEANGPDGRLECAIVVGVTDDWVDVKYKGSNSTQNQLSLDDVQPYYSLESGDIVEVLARDGIWKEGQLLDFYHESDASETTYKVYVNRRAYIFYQDRVRPLSLLLKVGARIMANYEGNGEWFPGTIVKVHGDSRSYDIRFDDSDFEEYVERERIQMI